MAVAAAAYAGKYGITAWQAFMARTPTARMWKFFEGGFQPVMTTREAAMILGVRTVNNFVVKVQVKLPFAQYTSNCKPAVVYTSVTIVNTMIQNQCFFPVHRILYLYAACVQYN
ncbi:hypothetical protein CUMW_084730 [Citrus unshiu]|nr:hypothetical protein CUMW_084730 [Citrus unshiu]